MQWNDSPIDHWIIKASGIDPMMLNDLGRVKYRLRQVVEHLNLTMIATRGHHFGPGCTVIALLAESHLSIHTWPEHGFFYADVATCGPPLNREAIGEVFSRVFKADFLRITRCEK